MSFGLVLYNGSGVPVFDSRAAVAGVVADVVTITQGSGTTVKSYPAFAGNTVEFWNPVDALVSVDYALGYPRIAFTAMSVGDYSCIVVMQ